MSGKEIELKKKQQQVSRLSEKSFFSVFTALQKLKNRTERSTNQLIYRRKFWPSSPVENNVVMLFCTLEVE